MIGMYTASLIPKDDEVDDEVKPSLAEKTPGLRAGSDDHMLT